MTDLQLNNFFGVLSVGCPLQTALDAADLSRAEYDAKYRSDPQFSKRLHYTVAKSEYDAMKLVKEVAVEKKDWKASVWWLERCHPERYESRPLRSISLDEFEAFRADIAALINTQVHDPADHRRVLDKLRELTNRFVPEVTSQPTDEEELAADEHGWNTDKAEELEDPLKAIPSNHDQPSSEVDDGVICED